MEERVHMCIGVRHFRILGDEKLTTEEVAKSQNATGPIVIVSRWRTGVIISEFRTWKGL
jgi:hypothetical protein